MKKCMYCNDATMQFGNSEHPTLCNDHFNLRRGEPLHVVNKRRAVNNMPLLMWPTKRTNIQSDTYMLAAIVLFASIPALIGRLFGYGGRR